MQVFAGEDAELDGEEWHPFEVRRFVKRSIITHLAASDDFVVEAEQGCLCREHIRGSIKHPSAPAGSDTGCKLHPRLKKLGRFSVSELALDISHVAPDAEEEVDSGRCRCGQISSSLAVFSSTLPAGLQRMR